MNAILEHIKGKAILAPLAGVTDQPFRIIVKEAGASLMFSELVSAEGLVRDSQKTFQLMHFTHAERPIGIQIFGNHPETMGRAAHVAESLQPDIIDVNFGCPAKKVVNGGAGAAILKDLKLLKAIVKAVVTSVSTPVSCKIRSGWNPESIVAKETARIIEGEGASLLTLHPRPRTLGFKGNADWSLIRQVREVIRIPLIGNGDILTSQDAKRMIDETGCDGVMVGRGIMGRPWLLHQIDHYLESGEQLPDPPPEACIQICLKHYHLALKILGLSRGVKEMRKHIGWYLKGMPGVSKIRSQLMILEDPNQVIQLLENYARILSESNAEKIVHSG